MYFSPAMDDEILEICFTVFTTKLAKKLDSIDQFSKDCYKSDTTDLVLKVDGKVFPTTGQFLGKPIKHLQEFSK